MSTAAFYKIIASSFLVLLFLAGCGSIVDKIGESVAEKVTEKVVESSTGNKVDLDLDGDNGSISIKGKNGATFIAGGGSERPESVPADMPSVTGAKNFSWLGSQDGGMFGYELDKGANYKTVCKEQMELLAKAGWSADDSFAMDVEEMMSRTMENAIAKMSINCSMNDDGVVAVALVKSKK